MFSNKSQSAFYIYNAWRMKIIKKKSSEFTPFLYFDSDLLFRQGSKSFLVLFMLNTPHLQDEKKLFTRIASGDLIEIQRRKLGV